MRNLFLIIPFFISVLFFNCSTETVAPNAEVSIDVKASNNNDNNAFTIFKVLIENMGSEDATYPIVLSPGIYIVQKKDSEPLFTPWEQDFGEGLEAIAEDGNPTNLNANLENNPKVRSHGTFGSGPIPPGGSYEFYITAKHNDYLNFATMFVQSNDLFIAPAAEGFALFTEVKTPFSGEITMYLDLWDTGTEVNEEPGVGPNQAPRQAGANTGTTENGVVRLVDDGYTYPDISEFMRVTVTPE